MTNFKQKDNTMPKIYMLIGVPGSGKSTFVKSQISKWEDSFTVLSTDDYIEKMAEDRNTTYDNLFHECINDAHRALYDKLKESIFKGDNIVWDQTNLTQKSRLTKLKQIPCNYKRIAVFFDKPSDLDTRLSNRTGKTIPLDVVDDMVSKIQLPANEEKYDEVLLVNARGIYFHFKN